MRKKRLPSWFVYMLLCHDGSLYTGATCDVKRRLAQHQQGKGARYTRARLPVSLVFRKAAGNQSLAFREEARLKKLRREEKLRLLTPAMRRRVLHHPNFR